MNIRVTNNSRTINATIKCKVCRQEFFVGVGASGKCNPCLGVTQEERERLVKIGH